MPNKHNANGRHHIPKMKFRVRNWREYDAALRTRGSLKLGLVFRQPLRKTEGLMASIFDLLELELKAPDHSTVSRRAMRLKSISKRCALPAGPAHILIDSTGLKVFGAGEWLPEKSLESCRDAAQKKG